MKIAIIIVTFHTDPKQLQTLQTQLKPMESAKTYIIDNTDTKKGYAAGVNRGLQKALADHYDYYVILNPDISVEGITETILLRASEHFDIWGFAMNQNNTMYYGGEIDKRRLSGGLIQIEPKERFSKVDFVTGSCFIFKRKVLDATGFWDESFGMYYEDVDYCWRAKQKGLRIGIDTQFTYKHFEQSGSSVQKEMMLAKNRLRFFLRHATIKQFIFEIIRIPVTFIEHCLIFGKRWRASLQ